MAKRIPAVKTEYRGVEFRSKLEARYARALDKLGIVWDYECGGFKFDDGRYYAPDFYLPEIDMYLEVKGALGGKDMIKVDKLVREAHQTVVVGDPAGDLMLADGKSGFMDGGFSPSLIAQCNDCKRYYFTSSYYDEDICPSCGSDKYDASDWRLFDYADTLPSGSCPVCGAKVH